MSMRIAVVARSADRAGGAETYLESVVPLLVQRRHEVAVCLEVPAGAADLGACARFALTPDLGRAGFPDVRRWKPDVVFANGLLDSRSEEALLGIAPNVLLAHTYRGTCISGTKTRSWPLPVPCERVLGWGCVPQYFPRRCGGRSPLTLARDFTTERHRQRLLSRYARVLTLSAHMRREYVRNGAPVGGTFVLPYFAPDVEPAPERLRGADAWSLLYAGRMEPLKGGDLFLETLPQVRRMLRVPLQVTFAGEGRSRRPWEAQAARIRRELPDVSIRFVGWLDQHGLTAALRAADLLVLPSRWPEPFGLVGTEAAAHGVPAAAFAVGGIPEWLEDGETGHLAAPAPAPAAALAAAVVACLGDRAHYARLCAAARRRAGEHPVGRHVDALAAHLAAAAGAASPRAGAIA